MLTIRRSEERGQVDAGWLRSRHTFSFGGYHDPNQMGFGHLRVINQDHVSPGAGFQPHGHRNMEIVSYVLSGVLSHEDNQGGGGDIRPGEVQLMSAGSGIRHSEMNGSERDPVRFLQIWIVPNEEETEPGYAQHDFGQESGIRLIVSGDGRDDALKIRQDVEIYRALLPAGAHESFLLTRPRSWIQVVEGELEVDGEDLLEGDAAAIEDQDTIQLHARTDVEALIFVLE